MRAPSARSASIVLIYTTAATRKEAVNIAESLLRQRRIACANITKGNSVYRWNGRVEETTEFYVLMKTSSRNVKSVEKEVQKLSSYECPCFLQIPVKHASKSCLSWLTQEIGDGQ